MRIIALAALFCAALAAAQEARTISGVVIRQNTRNPVKRAAMVLRSNRGEDSYRALSGLDGRFTFSGVPPGEYRIESPLWSIKTLVGPDGPLDRRRITVSAGTELAGLVAQVSAPGLIRGKVSYEDAEPAWAQVTLVRAGGDTDRTAEATSTNSRGEYEIAGISPGKYYVVAVPLEESRYVAFAPSSSRDNDTRLPVGYAHSFYPGVSSLRSAAPVAVAEDSEIDGINIGLRPVPLVSIHCTVLNSATGRRLTGELSITAIGVTGFLTEAPADLTASMGPDGGFTFRGVPAGTYTLRGSGPEWNIEEDVEVGSAPEQYTTVYYDPPREVEGLLRMDTAAKPAPKSLQVMYTADSGGIIQIGEDGTFHWAVSPGDIHSIRLPDSADPDLYIRSVTLDGHQTTGLSIPPGAGPVRLELTIGSGAAQLRTEAIDAEDETKIAVLPTSGNSSRIGIRIEKGEDGRYTASRIPPGPVIVLAWNGDAPCDFAIPSSCAAAGTTVTLQSGDNQNLRIPVAK